jgi:hypothetical protein
MVESVKTVHPTPGIGPISNVQDWIELADDILLKNEPFKKNVAIPYFKDIFKDI